MKRRLLFVLMAALLLLCACTHDETTIQQEHPFSFYYAAGQIDYGQDDGVIRAEQREFDAQKEQIEALLEQYFRGPADKTLTMPFPEGTQMLNVSHEPSTAVILLSEEYTRLTGIAKSVADACLAKTLFGVEGLERVAIKAADGTVTTLTKKNIVLTDTGAQVQDTSVTLYFADVENRFLMAEERSTNPIDESLLPEFIVKQLIAGTTQRGYTNTIPAGTKLLSTRLSDGICTVDLSLDFTANGPKTHAEERMTVYSIVNSLTRLDAVSAVELRVDGESVGTYLHMNLHEPLRADESVIGPVKTASGEIKATLCIYDGIHLLEVPMRVPTTGNEETAQAVLRALIGFESHNVYFNPIPHETGINALRVEDDLCYVDLSGEFLREMTPEDLRIAIHSIVATLCRSELAQRVVITVDGAAPAAEYEKPLSCNEAWIAA